MKVCIVGAGVVGLCTALEIQKQFRNLDVTIIAEKFGEDTTSDGAAGLFLAFDHFVGPTKDITKKWINDSYRYYNDLIEKENCGVFSLSGYSFSNTCDDDCWRKSVNDGSIQYRFMEKEELNQFNIKFKHGVFLSTIGIPCRKFLPWCAERFKENGGRIICGKVNSFDSLVTDYDVIFNCCGVNARFLCDDIDVYPIRGQVAQVKAPWVKDFYMFGSNYIIPCGYGDVVTLGGTKDFESFDTETDNYTASSIIDKCNQFLPNLRGAPLVRHWVGLRPYRTRVRVEVEQQHSAVLIHNYGHGGCGVTTAPGTSLHAVNLFRDFVTFRKNYSRL